MIVEIINPQGKVSYRRPHNDKAVLEAFNTVGYKIRVQRPFSFPTTLDFAILDYFPKEWNLPLISVEFKEGYIYLTKGTER